MSEEVKEYIEANDRFADHCEIELTEVEAGRARAEMEVQSFHLNSHGSVHGGAIFSLADYAFAAASNQSGLQAPGIQTSVNFFKGLSEGELTATAEPVHEHPKLATYRVEVVDEAGDLVADFEGTVYRRSEKFPPEE